MTQPQRIPVLMKTSAVINAAFALNAAVKVLQDAGLSDTTTLNDMKLLSAELTAALDRTLRPKRDYEPQGQQDVSFGDAPTEIHLTAIQA